MGDPKAAVAEEPAPHGDRINMGAYGGTPQASRGSEHVIYHVDALGGRDWNDGRSRARAFKTIQHAIDMAHDGDTVLVWPGVYVEEITFVRKAITVQSAADAAVLSGPDGFGASFYFAESSRSVLANFVITGCDQGVFCEGASPTLKNLTITGNRFGITAYSGSNPNIVNCIVWGNRDGDLWDCEARFSCLEQSVADKSRGNIRTNPLFADPERGDYHLKSQFGRYEAQFDRWVTDNVTSPCIDSGDSEEYPRSEPMPNGARVNMGAYGGTPFASKSSWPALDSTGQFGVVFDFDAAFDRDAALGSETIPAAPQR
jgi:parallel beta-helix repeat protein